MRQSQLDFLSPKSQTPVAEPELPPKHSILRKEFAEFEQPKLASTRQLEKFDCWDLDLDKTPDQWVETYREKIGPHASCPVYERGKYIWEPVTLLGYDPHKKRYIVEVTSGMIKQVNRLSIKFNDENPVLFEKRVSMARKLQQDFFEEHNFTNYVDALSSKDYSLLSYDIRHSIVQKTVAPFKDKDQRSSIENNSPVFRKLIDETVKEYER